MGTSKHGWALVLTTQVIGKYSNTRIRNFSASRIEYVLTFGLWALHNVLCILINWDLMDNHIRTGILSDQQLSHLNEIKGLFGNGFDHALRGILLGKGSTMVFMFAGAFSYYTDDEAEGGKLEKVSNISVMHLSLCVVETFDHHFNQIMDQYVHRQPPWTIERSSVLCPWNSDYFFLKFKDTQSSKIMMHWNLPPNMDAHLKELWEAAESPEGAAGE